MSAAVEYRGVVKSFPGFTLGPLDFELTRGTVVALVGPNGAGKTTALKCLVGLIQPDEGTIAVDGRRINDALWKRALGYVGEEHAFFDNWSGERNLGFLSTFYPAWSDARAGELAERFGLRLDQPVKSLSRGDRAKLSLVSALAHSPRLLVLDEPTAGLDPVVRADFLETLWELQEDEERTILYSTHITSDLERTADFVTFLQDGRVVFSRPKDEVVGNWGVVKGGREILDDQARAFFEGVREREHGFEGLTSKLEEARQRFGDHAVIDRASLDDIMVLMGEGER